MTNALMKNELIKYKYSSYMYKSCYVEEVVSDVLIENRSPYEKDQFTDVPNGTRSTWFRYENDIRILYSFFERFTNIERLNKYSKNDVLKFINNINERVVNLDSKHIPINIKEKYIENLKLFLDIYTLYSNSNNKKLIDIILENDCIWNDFFEDNIDLISSFLRQDYALINKVLNNIIT